MATTAVSSSKGDQKQSKNNQTSANNLNDTPITEEELKKKDTPVTVNDVLRLKKTYKRY